MASITLSSTHATDGFDMRGRDASAIISVVTGVAAASASNATQVTYTGSVLTLVLNGSFSGANAHGDPTSGTITSYQLSVLSGTATKTIVVSDLSLSVTDFFAFIASNDVAALNALVFGGDDTVTGSALKDTIQGHSGADLLNGGDGGAGDDQFIVDDAGDIAFENAGEGADTVTASVSYSLRANFEALVLAGSGGAIDGTGNALDNTLTGNAFANTLNGSSGNDTLIGGAGDDTFVFKPGTGDDVVTDFVAGGAEDSIDLSAYDGSGVTWSITQVGADTLFSFSNGDSITLTNVDSTELVQNDPFHYS